MVRVRIERDPSGNIKSISASGHAGFAERGSDIVCSAVSALLQTLRLGLANLGACGSFSSVSGGFMRVSLPDFEGRDDSIRASFLFDTVASALFEIADSYRGFVRVENFSEKRGR